MKRVDELRVNGIKGSRECSGSREGKCQKDINESTELFINGEWLREKPAMIQALTNFWENKYRVYEVNKPQEVRIAMEEWC